MSHTVRAAGGIVCRRLERGLEVVVVHRPRYDDWSFPKGKAAPGESDEACALREVEEETGLGCELHEELPSSEYRDRRGRQKTVRYWVMSARENDLRPREEVDVGRWVTPDEAHELLSYERDRELLRIVAGKSARAIIVRHAAAGDRAEWEGDDSLRPLDARGAEQARALVAELDGFPVGRVVSSPAVRCQQTVEPLARRHGLAVEPRVELAEGSSRGDALELLRAAGDRIVACTHGDVIEQLIGREGPTGGFWVLELATDPPRIVHAVAPAL